MSLSSSRSVELEELALSNVELSELDKCRSSHSVMCVGVLVDVTISNVCSGIVEIFCLLVLVLLVSWI